MELVTIRAGKTQDEAFRLRVYASTRAEELAFTGWPETVQAAFIQMQFAAQQQHYTAMYPQAQVSIIEIDALPAGYLTVHRTDSEIRLLDIALLPEFRGRRIGSGILRELQTEAQAQRKALRLSVIATSPARRLYERLGFTVTPGDRPGINDLYVEMEWTGSSIHEHIVG